jgi:hypothetical protein
LPLPPICTTVPRLAICGPLALEVSYTKATNPNRSRRGSGCVVAGKWPGHPFKLLVATFSPLEAQIKELDLEINRRSKEEPTARRLMTIPRVGPIAATAITALVPAAENFRTGVTLLPGSR